MHPAGDRAPLDVAVALKTLRAASGEARVVLRDVAFSLQEGEVCALLGPSGSGKTTLLRLIAGLDADFEGRVSLPARCRIGMVFQEPRLLPWRSVADNLRLAGAPVGKGLDDIIATLDLAGHLGHFPGELSLGLARRVAIARAFAIDPDLLILDEPFASLDAPLARRLRGELGSLVEQKKTTTLIVTHDVEEAVALADRILILSPAPGHVVADRTIATPRLALAPAAAARIGAEVSSIMARAQS
jgi:sulfonate transport system ATP-binding protein